VNIGDHLTGGNGIDLLGFLS